MAYPRSKHLSYRLQSRLRGKSNNSRWLLAGLGVGAALTLAVASMRRPPSVVLALDLSHPPAELNPTSIFASPLAKPNHWDTIRVLEYAAKDPKVRGIIANVGPAAQWNMAQAQEIRQASRKRGQHRAAALHPHPLPASRSQGALLVCPSLLCLSACGHS